MEERVKTPEQYQKEIDLLNQMIIEHERDYIKNEFHLKDLFFIPQNIGFEPIDLKDPEYGSTVGIVYVKDGYAISKDKDGFWIIKSASGDISNKLFISNMMEGILALRMSGMNMSSEKDMLIQSDMIEEINSLIDNHFDEEEQKELGQGE